MTNITSSVQPEVLSHAELMEKGKEFIGIMYLGSARAGKLEYTSHPIMTGIEAPDGLYHYKVNHDADYKVSYDFVSTHNAKLLQREKNTSKLFNHAIVASFIFNLVGLMLISLTQKADHIVGLFVASIFFGFLYYFFAPKSLIQDYNNIPLFTRLAQYPVNERWLTINEKLFEDHSNIISMSNIREICTKNGIGLLRINPYNALISNHIAPVKEDQNTDIQTKKTDHPIFSNVQFTKIIIPILFVFNLFVLFIVEMGDTIKDHDFHPEQSITYNLPYRNFEEILPIQNKKAQQINTKTPKPLASNPSDMPGLSLEDLGKGYYNSSEEPRKLQPELLFNDERQRLMIIFKLDCPNSKIANDYARHILDTFSVSTLVLINDRFNKISYKNTLAYWDLYNFDDIELAKAKKEQLESIFSSSSLGFKIELVIVTNPTKG